MKRLTNKIIASAVMGGCLLAATSSPALDVYLRAEAFTKTLAGGKQVLMWGFAQDSDLNFDDATAPTVPGPQINVPDTDTTLIIHLKNNLTVPVSIVVPNQNGYVRDADHATFVDDQGRTRARSFAKETAPAGTGTYQWDNLTPGTYLYFSGSHSSLQVQMGLYGALVHKTDTGEAYPGHTPAAEYLVLFSEIDSTVHDAVAAGNYRDFTDPAWVPVDPNLPVVDSTIHSEPDYFLINGEAYTAGQTAVPVGTAAQSILLRLLNASVNTRVPVVYGLDQTIIAEDGRLYPYPRILTAPELPALKTMDALVTPAVAGTYPLYDRGLGLVNGTSSPGGMLVHLQVAP